MIVLVRIGFEETEYTVDEEASVLEVCVRARQADDVTPHTRGGINNRP